MHVTPINKNKVFKHEEYCYSISCYIAMWRHITSNNMSNIICKLQCLHLSSPCYCNCVVQLWNHRHFIGNYSKLYFTDSKTSTQTLDAKTVNIDEMLLKVTYSLRHLGSTLKKYSLQSCFMHATKIRQCLPPSTANSPSLVSSDLDKSRSVALYIL